ncbi:Protein of unknown function [Bacillus mycoides]|uniref:Uncharacterized protein n=1 Tax=Bacillus mycoides TaxID=1405 RepID=A0A1C3ZJ95_BACMY|nr:Protein of unknown function [Bacillus mycoides]SCB82479.1 Protein of unknown function [Bacillus mycoides]
MGVFLFIISSIIIMTPVSLVHVA